MHSMVHSVIARTIIWLVRPALQDELRRLGVPGEYRRPQGESRLDFARLSEEQRKALRCAVEIEIPVSFPGEKSWLFDQPARRITMRAR